MRSCHIDDCDRPFYSRDLCRKHYDRKRSKGEITPLPRRNSGRICEVEQCNNKAKSRGICGKHYLRLWKTGDPLGVRTPTIEQRFWEKVEIVSPEECWEWLGHRMRHGYGQFSYPGHRIGRAHVFSYELHNGPVPEGMEVLHACDNPPCVNPSHLSADTHAENMGQMADRKRWPRKLTDAQMVEIRDSPEIQKVLAKRYGISQGYVSSIKRHYVEGMHRTFTS